MMKEAEELSPHSGRKGGRDGRMDGGMLTKDRRNSGTQKRSLKGVTQGLIAGARLGRCATCTMPLDKNHDLSLCAKNPQRHKVVQARKDSTGGKKKGVEKWMPVDQSLHRKSSSQSMPPHSPHSTGGAAGALPERASVAVKVKVTVPVERLVGGRPVRL
jgi:hypothetical protein